MKFAFIFFIFITGFAELSAQAMSEETAVFQEEIESLLLNWKHEDYAEIMLEIHAYQQKQDKKSGFRERVSFKFVNDSVFQQTFKRSFKWSFYRSKQTYYGLIKEGAILSYDLSTNKPLYNGSREEKDSADYKLIIGKRFNGKDSVAYQQRLQFDDKNRLIESLYTSEAIAGLAQWKYIGDSIVKFIMFKIEHKDTVPSYESYAHKMLVPQGGKISDTLNTTLYQPTLKTNSFVTVKHHEFKENGQLSQITRYDYENHNIEWTEKATMKLSYKNE